jgi:FAD/FMN-containing dehydrogenase
MDCGPGLFQSFNGYGSCETVKEVLTPESVAEVQVMVKTRRGGKIRVVGARHSSLGLLCTEGSVISVEKLGRILGIEVFEGEETVLVEAGVKIFDLLEWLKDHGRSIVGYGMPMLRNATLGGALATSSHGSSTTQVSSLNDIVASIEIVDWQGGLKEYSSASVPRIHWEAARANLGLMGVMTRIRLRIRPHVNLRVVEDELPEQSLFDVQDPVDLVRGCDYAQFLWAPTLSRLRRICGKETLAPADPHATNAFLEYDGITSLERTPIAIAFLEKSACKAPLRCVTHYRAAQNNLSTNFFVSRNERGERIRVTDFVAEHGKVMTSVYALPKTMQVRTLEVVVPPGRSRQALLAIRDLVRRRPCELFGALWLRFTRVTSSSLIGNNVASSRYHGNDLALFIELEAYTPKGLTAEQFAEYDELNTALLKTLIDQFDARPHWGKGERWTHVYSQSHDTFDGRREAFRKALDEVDPHGVFANDFSDEVGLTR